jgi:hypothetical protein
MNAILAAASLASLGVCAAAPLLFLWGGASMEAYKNLLLAGSIAYFTFATMWSARRGGR